MVYYHITSEENANKILKEGLIPAIGLNSKMAQESMRCTYLTDFKSIPLWSVLLNYDNMVILEVDTNVPTWTMEWDDRYIEYVTDKIIPPENIRICERPIIIDLKKCTTQLLCMYMVTLSVLCTRIARLYARTEMIPEEVYKNVKGLVGVLKRFDENNLDEECIEVIRNKIKEYGEDGEYTLCDTYFNEKFKLYELFNMIDLGSDYWNPVFREMYQNIVRLYGKALDVNSGGFECQGRKL